MVSSASAHSPPTDSAKRPRGILKNSHSYQHQPMGSPPTETMATSPIEEASEVQARRPSMPGRELSEKEIVQLNTELNAGNGHRRNSSNPRSSISRRQSSSEAFETASGDKASGSPRLQWDEANLFLNEGQMGGRMKIDEPKTPFVHGEQLGDPEEEEDEVAPGIDPNQLVVDELDKAHQIESAEGGAKPRVRQPREDEIPDFDLGEPEQELQRRASDGERRVVVDPDAMEVDGRSHGEDVNMNDEEKTKHRQFEAMRKKHYEMKNIKNLLGHGPEELADEEEE